MKDLSGRASAVLQHYRAVESLRYAEKGRLLETLQTRAARGDMPRASFDLPPPEPVPPASLLERIWRGPLAKAGVGVVTVAATAAIVGVAATRSRAPGPVVSKPVPFANDPGTLNHARPEPLPAPPEPRVDEPTGPPAVTPSSKARAKTAGSARAPASTPRETSDEATVDEEVLLLRRAQLSLRSGDPRRAMALLDEHAEKFPEGKLADAREVARMVTLCELGARAAAREKADRFLAQYPASPFSDRVRRICTDSEP
jgi:hypothetical protein